MNRVKNILEEEICNVKTDKELQSKVYLRNSCQPIDTRSHSGESGSTHPM